MNARARQPRACPAAQPAMRADFMQEMRRFLPVAAVRDTIERAPYWSYLTDLIADLGRKAIAALPDAC